jgi:DNA invertase Pin-like site-specific DNA recombinase
MPPDAPLRAVALIRMSTDRQQDSPERQRALFAEYCARWSLTPAGEYADLGISATHTKLEQRPGIMAM